MAWALLLTLNPVIVQIERTGVTELPGGEEVRIHSHVGPASGLVIRRAVEVASPDVACEVGLAFGVSALYILDAMVAAGRGRLIGMDPAQHDSTWRGGGLYNLQRAGLLGRYEFHEEPSQVVLPRLAAAQTRIQLAFLDGWHTFDHTLVDFFYVDRMLDVGGVVVLDDVGYPSIQRLCHFIVTNRSYSLLDWAPLDVEPSWRSRLKRMVRQILLPVVRDNFTPSGRALALEAQLNRVQLVALRKDGEDRRSFDHFVAF